MSAPRSVKFDEPVAISDAGGEVVCCEISRARTSSGGLRFFSLGGSLGTGVLGEGGLETFL